MESNQNSTGKVNIEQSLIKDIVLQNIKTVDLMEKYNIDFCCNGKRTLIDALTENNIDRNKFMSELQNSMNESGNDSLRVDEWDLSTLTQFIVDNHHSYVRKAIPTIDTHLDKIINKHGAKYGYLKNVRDEFYNLANELFNHMQKEERILFPLIKYLEESKKFNEKPKTGGFGTIKNPIMKMESEHTSAGSALENIRNLTSNFSLPDDACTTFNITYNELAAFEKDLHRHIHLENNILFPKAIKLEEELLNIETNK